jgi:hypothetical protein
MRFAFDWPAVSPSARVGLRSSDIAHDLHENGIVSPIEGLGLQVAEHWPLWGGLRDGQNNSCIGGTAGGFGRLSERARTLSWKPDDQPDDRHGEERRAEPKPLRTLRFGLELVHFPLAFSPSSTSRRMASERVA